MGFEQLIADSARYYADRFAEHGAQPRGVDWNDEASQQLRFRQLLGIVDSRDAVFSITDFGCGYGALVEALEEAGRPFAYQGFDVAEPLLRRARELHDGSDRTFVADVAQLHPTDYLVASGVFNVRQTCDAGEWTDYVVETLRAVRRLATRGFSFNMLTSYSDRDRMRPDLYYGDPCFFFDLCKREFSSHVALRHDYGLWEFTVLVRSEPVNE